MKLASGLVAVCILAAAKASPGGYTLKGGVFDFKRPLDYERAAVHAGKFAWSQKYAQEVEEQGAAFGVRSEKRQAPAYIPTFFYQPSQPRCSDSSCSATTILRSHAKRGLPKASLL